MTRKKGGKQSKAAANEEMKTAETLDTPLDRSNSQVDSDESQSKSKTSFYISKATQTALKAASEKYELSQGQIVDLAPRMFERIVQRSLERRARSIESLKTLNEQIEATVRKMASVAPHLSTILISLAELFSQLIKCEEDAVRDKVINRTAAKDFVWDGRDYDPLIETLYRFGLDEETNPYEKDIEDVFGEEGKRIFSNIGPSEQKEGADANN
jgi:hypothetical protein